MSRRFVHTPEGVRDIYGQEYAKKLAVEEHLHHTFRSFGYQDIQTPIFEFFDVFSKEIGTTPSKELYKFFDKEGNTLVLRPDFTPSVARCAAKYFFDETLPVRFCYSGNTFTNTSNLQGKLKEVTQMGVEFIGEPTVYADAEAIALVVEALLNTGLEKFQISVGDVEYFRGLCREAGLDEETESALRNFISEKNIFGAEELLIQGNITEKYRENLLKVSELFGSFDVIEHAKKLVNNPVSTEALSRLEKLYEVLKQYGVEKYISFDLGLLSKYHYYTGVIFKAYTYGIGDAIVKGGRYDNLLEKFGKKASAIGFAIVVDDVLEALSRQNIHVDIETTDTMIVYKENAHEKALAEAKALIKAGKNTGLLPAAADKTEADYEAYARMNRFSRILYMEADGSTTLVSVSEGKEN